MVISRNTFVRSPVRQFSAWSVVFAGMLCAASACAEQVDIHGPAKSVAFGTAVTVLPNGNFVVTDPEYGPRTHFGAVYLYSPRGVLISTLAGSTRNDLVGYDGITVLADGNFVVRSPFWSNGANASVGAVTWVDGAAGLSGTVSAANSLIGATTGDGVGYDGVTPLSNGNYVVASSYWHNGVAQWAGAVTLAPGHSAFSGVVSAGNSLVGTTAKDFVGVGGVTALSNGNYVVNNYLWNNGAATNAGAVTWINGNAGLTGAVSISNSLVGTSAGDFVGEGTIVVLTNGNFVVESRDWDNGTTPNVGAVTWVNGSTGFAGAVSASNSLIGTTANDNVGDYGTTALSNGNYVVASPRWNNGASTRAGAVTWANGNTGLIGVVSIGNSLVGSSFNDSVGDRITALSNGNYVASSAYWNNGAGAVTWGNGGSGVSGAVSVSNSLVGSPGDGVGGLAALSNGNYVAISPFWSNGATQYVGAVTWANGNTGLVGVISPANSLIGTSPDDKVGYGGGVALSDGNYTVASTYWSDGATEGVGAVTWADGNTGLIGVVSSGNSLIGSTANDNVGYGGIALSKGGYVVTSPVWDNGTLSDAGAATWVAANAGSTGVVSTGNSLVGITSGHTPAAEGPYITAPSAIPLSNGDYLVVSPHFDNGSIIDAGAVSVGRRSGGLVGPVNAANSVIGTVAGAGREMVFAFDATRDTLVVGQPAANIVSLFKTDLLFTNSFE